MSVKDQILMENARFKAHTAKLKAISQYYPIIKQDVHDGSIFLTTLVRIERDGKWYIVHCVESFTPTKPEDFVQSFKNMMFNVHQIQYLYQISGTMEDIDPLQQSEMDRLKEEHDKINNR